MIERINLIEKEPFQFTYEKLLMGGAGAVAFCLLLLGLQIGRVAFNKMRMSGLETEIIILRHEREQLLERTPQKLEGGTHAELKNILQGVPQWSLLIRDLGKRLPGSVWLSGLKGLTQVTKATQKTDEKKEKERKGKALEPDKKGLSLSGVARTPADLGLFMEQLKESPFVRHPVLVSSKREEGGFTFVIECDIVPAT